MAALWTFGAHPLQSPLTPYSAVIFLNACNVFFTLEKDPIVFESMKLTNAIKTIITVARKCLHSNVDAVQKSSWRSAVMLIVSYNVDRYL